MDWFSQQGLEHAAVLLHDRLVRTGDRFQFRSIRNPKDERVIETARRLQHGASSAATSHDWHAAHFTVMHADFAPETIRLPEHHESLARFPNPQDFIRAGTSAPIKQRFIACQVFRRLGKGEIKEFHGAGFGQGLATGFGHASI